MSDLYWEETGEEAPVVLVHEAVADSRMWDPQWETFPRAHRTIRFDQRGYGRSPLEPGVMSHAGDLVELLDTVGLERTALVGGSLGGAHGEAVAAQIVPEHLADVRLVVDHDDGGLIGHLHPGLRPRLAASRAGAIMRRRGGVHNRRRDGRDN